MRLEKEWVVPEPDLALVNEMARGLGVSEALGKLLVGRGFRSPREALAFLDTSLDRLSNPFLLNEMVNAVGRVRLARRRGETVFIAGDRDVDGVTSTALLVNLMKLFGINCRWRVPLPEDGYGLSVRAVEAAAAAGAKLLIAVDCGIRDFAGAERAEKLGLDLIILDHHEPAEKLPRAWAVVDPKRGDSRYPFSELSACGLAFKFAQALLLSEDEEFYGKEIVVFDFETSGFQPSRAQIIEMGAVKTLNGNVLEEFSSFVECPSPLDPSCTEVHGIRDEDLRGAPPLEEVLPRFLEFVGDAILVAHNAPFDIKFLNSALKECGLPRLKNPVWDTLRMARTHFPAMGHSLENMAEELGLKLDQAHRAVDDARATFELLKRIVVRRNAKLLAFLGEHLDLVALSTVADVVPLVDENRVLVKKGLEKLSSSRRPGIVALRTALLRRGSDPTAKDVSWSFAPLINAAGRMGRAALAVNLLLTRNEREASEIVAKLTALNTERKERVKTNMEAVIAELEETFDPERDMAVVVCVRDIEHGVTGIVANRLLHDLGRPVAVLIEDERGIARGTTRSIEGFDITVALKRLEHLLLKWGGHSGAAGLSLRMENLEAFRQGLNELVAREIPPERLRPRLRIDAELQPDEINDRLVKELELVEPTGHGNERPVFCIRSARVGEIRRMGDQEQHLKVTVESRNGPLEFVAWNVDDALVPYPGEEIDVAFGLERNEWRGLERIQCLVEDIKRRGRV
ncbi:MAG: single-stranded-DNA-specific exonuclease RecJ [Candidatus Hydrogenedentota bacterium]|nr:MAG: single-stranded-DNA-specific exonuclease RecJ [Candidatus Hydrogenedentota bacterium]